jgi:alpha-galactosidase
MKRTTIWYSWLLTLLMAVCGFTAALSAQVVPTETLPTPIGPPMGWNSWDSYGMSISEAQFRANATVLHDKLLPFGWRYAVIDEGWYFPNPDDRPHPEKLLYAMDTHGRLLPAPARYPSSETGETPRRDGQTLLYEHSDGFKALGEWLHAQGLLFGIHVIRGIPKESVRLNLPIAGSTYRTSDAADAADTCPWDPTSVGVRDNAAGQAWYDALIGQYAGWGLDFVKVDCISDHPYRESEIRQLHNAIEKSGRPMVLSLSPGPTALSHAAELSPLAQMWRISDDIWDVWQTTEAQPQTIKSQFARLAAWAPYNRPGNWPDADMLPIGELRPEPGGGGAGARASRLTADEQQTQLTLWSIARSPLILGNNLTMMDAPTLRLLTNRAILRVNQTATLSREALHDGNLVVWEAEGMTGGESAIALFNLGDTPLTASRTLAQFGVTAPGAHTLTNVWSGESMGFSGVLSVTLPPHGSAMFLLKP